MSSENGTKINQLLKMWPKGTVMLVNWLKKNGYSQQLINKYKTLHWLKKIGSGAFIRMDDHPEWTGALFALQKQLNFPIYPGGKTSLQLQGYAHTLPLGQNPSITLWSKSNIKLPAWFKNFNWEVEIKHISTNLFQDNFALIQKNMGEYDIMLSAPERAIMEVLYLVPGKNSFEEAGHLMEGLMTLRPEVINQLLENCNSIKIKRLFMFFAEKYHHQWYEKLNFSKIDLGQGKRLLVKNGVFNSKYRITIPKTF